MASTRTTRPLETVEKEVTAVLSSAAESGNRDLVLRAADRALQVHDRRVAVPPPRGAPGQMERSVVAEVAKYPVAQRGTPLAVAAIVLARRVDGGLAAADLGGVMREIRITLRALAATAPQESAQSKRDDLRKRREERLKAATQG